MTRRRCAVFVGNVWMITAKSRMIAFTIGLNDPCSGIGQKLHQVWPMDPPLRLPIWKRDASHAAGYHNWRTLPDYNLDFDKLCTTFKKVHSPRSNFLIQLCLLKGSFCCLFFFQGSVISLLLLTNRSLTKFLNCSSSSPIFGTFCTELATVVSMTSSVWIESNWRPSANRFRIPSKEGNNKTFYTFSGGQVSVWWWWWSSAEDMLP